jgi:hypothetical protein
MTSTSVTIRYCPRCERPTNHHETEPLYLPWPLTLLVLVVWILGMIPNPSKCQVCMIRKLQERRAHKRGGWRWARSL